MHSDNIKKIDWNLYKNILKLFAYYKLTILFYLYFLSVCQCAPGLKWAGDYIALIRLLVAFMFYVLCTMEQMLIKIIIIISLNKTKTLFLKAILFDWIWFQVSR